MANREMFPGFDLDPIKARLAAATPFDFCWWPEEGQAWGVRINGHTYTIPEGGRTFDWLHMITQAPKDLAALVAEVEALRWIRDVYRPHTIPLPVQLQEANARAEKAEAGVERLTYIMRDAIATLQFSSATHAVHARRKLDEALTTPEKVGSGNEASCPTCGPWPCPIHGGPPMPPEIELPEME